MSGLLRRIRATRSPAADPAPDEGAAWAEEVPEREPAAGDEPGGDVVLPAGVDLDRLVGERPSSQRRGRLRRRLRHLRRVREVLLRALGGLVFEIHKTGAAVDTLGEADQNGTADGPVAAKLARLSNVNAELRELEEILDDRRGRVLREPGIGGTCPLCGELHGSEARFCWACGTPVAPGAARPVVATGNLPALGAGGAAVQSWTQPETTPRPQPEPPTGVQDPQPAEADTAETAVTE